MPSFDVVSEINFQEVDNAINQTKKEVFNRYDFKGSKAEINFENKEIKILADDDYKLQAMKDIMTNKLIKRGIDPKSLDYQKEEEAAMGAKRQVVKLINGISKEKGKEIIAFIKEMKFKAQPSIQDEQVRVTSKSIDELQSIMQALRSKDLGIPLQFINMRS